MPDRWLIAAALAATAFMRGWFLLVFRHSALFPLLESAHDRMLYHEAAQAIADGQLWPIGSFSYMPLYPWVLGSVYAVVGSTPLAAAILGALADCVTAACIVVIARRWGAHPVPVLLVALVYAGYPLAIIYSGLTMPNTLNVMLVSLWLVVMDRLQPHRFRDWLLVGGVGGMVGLGFAGALVLMLAYCTAHLMIGWRRKTVPWRGVGLSLCLFLGFLAPVAIHNTRAEGTFVLLTTHGGFNFYMGNHERATGYPVRVENFRMTARAMLEDAHDFAEQAMGRELTRAESSAWWEGRGRTFWRNQTGAALRLSLRKVALFWNRLDVDDLRMREQLQITDGLFAAPLWPGFVWIGLLGGVGLLYGRSGPVGRLVLATGCVSIALFFVTARYRLTFVPLMLALGAAGLTQLIGDLRDRRWRSILLLPLLGVIFLPVQLPDLRPVDYHNVAIQFIALGEVAQARSIAEQGLALNPASADLHHARGHALAELGEYETAASAFAEAAQLRPHHPTARFNQALCLARLGAICDAAAVLEDRLQHQPGDLRSRSLWLELREYCR